MPSEIRVLHVDDEPDFGDLVAIYLERALDELSVTSVTDSDRALEILAEEPIDCLVSDYDMPNRNGVELLNAVREQGFDRPFILYTGKGSEEIASEAISAGVSDYLQKERGTDHYTVLANRIANLVSKHRAEAALERTRRYYEAILTRSTDYVMIIDQDGQLTYVSPAVERVLGYSPTALTSMNVFDLVAERDRPAATDAFREVFAGSATELTDQFRITHADGSTRWIEFKGRDLTTDAIISGVIITARDVTDTVEADLQNESIIENLPGYVYRHRAERGWPLLFVKGSAEAVTGYTPAELADVIQDAEEIIHPDDVPTIRNILDNDLEPGDSFDYTYRISTKSGDIQWIRDQGHVVADQLTGEQYLDGFIAITTEPK